MPVLVLVLVSELAGLGLGPLFLVSGCLVLVLILVSGGLVLVLVLVSDGLVLTTTLVDTVNQCLSTDVVSFLVKYRENPRYTIIKPQSCDNRGTIRKSYF